MQLSKFVAAICGAVATLTTVQALAETRFMGVYWDRATAVCTNKKTCQVLFKATIAHLRIEKVSCNFFYGLNGGPNHPTGFVLGRFKQAEGFEAGEYLAVGDPISVSTETIQFQPHQDTMFVVPKTWRPAILLNITSNATITMECTIAGTEAD